jgi:hypothetical protein
MKKRERERERERELKMSAVVEARLCRRAEKVLDYRDWGLSLGIKGPRNP